ncbi:hypothetical protein L798_06553 [Zootermopsis nevadensis]|uniref:Uncharacterized protein n=1 Tax=Zootermopsis nevadensis TaxID=136037 RepID=A0A067RHF7_ZOONE|nr:hypothetical protein L798_06553 [Zootermopsis nevadensis]
MLKLLDTSSIPITRTRLLKWYLEVKSLKLYQPPQQSSNSTLRNIRHLVTTAEVSEQSAVFREQKTDNWKQLMWRACWSACIKIKNINNRNKYETCWHKYR